MMEHNISNAYTKTHNRTMRRGPTQQEAQERKEKRKAFGPRPVAVDPASWFNAMPADLRPE